MTPAGLPDIADPMHLRLRDAANHAQTLAAPGFDLALYLGARFSVDAVWFGPKRIIVPGCADLLRQPTGWFSRPMVAEPLSTGTAWYGRSGE